MRAGVAVAAQLYCSTMGADDFVGDGETKAGAAGMGGAAERREEMLPRLRREAGAGVLDAD